MKRERGFSRAGQSSVLSLVTILSLLLGLVTALQPATVSAGSRTWTRLGLDGTAVSAVAIAPGNSSTLFAGTHGNGVSRSTDGGASWQSINGGIGNRYVNALSSDPSNSSVLLAATGRGALVGDAGAGIYRTTNRGVSWSSVLPNVFVSSLARSLQNPRLIYAGASGRVYKSTDGGATWSAHNLSYANADQLMNIDLSGVAVSPVDSNLVVAVGNTEGGTGFILRSADGGNSWVVVMGGQPSVFSVSFMPPSLRSGTTVLVGGQTGAWRSDDAGGSFHLVTEELGALGVRGFAYDPMSPTTAYAATEAGVFSGENGANDWRSIDTTLGNSIVLAVAAGPSSPTTLYAGTADGLWTNTLAAFNATTNLYFAEGSTQPPFDTWFLVQNPTSTPATVRFEFELQGGGGMRRDVVVAPTSRYSLYANQVIPGVAFSTRVESDQAIRVERAMYVGYDGDVVPGIAGPATRWLFAEGSTQSPFQTWLLLQNPSTSNVNATITYYLLDGGLPTIQNITLPPTSRTSVFANSVIPNQAFSTSVTSSQPIVVERAMYRFPGNAATANPGVGAPAMTWFFPNAKTATGRQAGSPIPFDSWLLLQNANNVTVHATITLLLDNGGSYIFTQILPPTSRQSVFLNDRIPNGSFAVRVDATGPIIAERSMYFGQEPRGAAAIPGAASLATTYYLAEGSTQSPFTEVIYVLNPNSAPMAAHVDFQLPGGQAVSRDYVVGPTRSLRINVNAVIPNSPVSARVTTSLPSLVERQMFFDKFGSLGGTDAIGIR